MKVIKYPSKEKWAEILRRPALNTESLFDTVRGIIDRVRTEGDKAVIEYEATFDKAELTSLAVTNEELEEGVALVSEELKAAISLAKQNIERFHAAQKFVGKKVETMPGVTCWQKAVGIEKVGLYIPGGTAPLFSTVLMLAVPAKIAGCKDIIAKEKYIRLSFLLHGWREWIEYSKPVVCRLLQLWLMERKVYRKFIRFSDREISM